MSNGAADGRPSALALRTHDVLTVLRQAVTRLWPEAPLLKAPHLRETEIATLPEEARGAGAQDATATIEGKILFP
jgi:hypothetical protein